MPSNRVWSAGSKRLRAQVYSRDGSALTETVHLSLTPAGGADTWEAGEWVGTEGANRVARTTAAATRSTGTYSLKVRLGGPAGEVIVCTPDITIT